MSINSCSINEYTINTLCGRRRAAIIATLVKDNHTHPQHVAPTTVLPLSMFRRDSSREEYIEDLTTLEQSEMSVTVTLDNKNYSQVLSNKPDMILVSVRGLTVSNQNSEVINISDIKIRVI